MRKILLGILLALAGAASFGVGIRRESTEVAEVQRPPPDESVPRASFLFAQGRDGKPLILTGSRWDIDISNYRAGEADFSVRVCFEYEGDEQYRFVQWDPAKLVVGCVEGGQQRIIGMIAAGAGKDSFGTYVPGETVRLSRRRTVLVVQSAGHVARTMLVPPPAGGKVGYAVLRGGAAPQFQVCERSPILVGDDFMREGEGEGAWQTIQGGAGSWRTNNLRNPLLSANAFYYFGQGKDAMSVMGSEWWSQYRYQCALRGPEKGCLGLVFAYKDPQNYGLFRWSAREFQEAAPPADAHALKGEAKRAGKGQKELILVRDGKRETVKSSEGGYLPNTWYSAEVRLTYGRVSVLVDEHELFSARDERLVSGAVGVYADVPRPEKEELDPKHQEAMINSLDALMRQNTVIDDVRVDEIEEIVETFDGGNGLLEGGWETLGGPWMVSPDGKPGLACGGSKGAAPSRALMGDPSWNGYELTADLTVAPGQRAGLVAMHRDESDFYTAEVATDGKEGQLVLTRWLNGEAQVADTAAFAPGEDGSASLKLAIRKGHVLATAEAPGGRTASAETLVRERVRGRIGLQAQSSSGPVRFGRVRVEFPEEREPLVTSNAIFGDEESMRSWTNPSSEWWPPREPYFVDNEPVDLQWHRSQFPGDVEMLVETREILRDKFEVALSVAKSGQGKNNGYVLRALFNCVPGGFARGQIQSGELMLIRAGTEVAKEEVASGEISEISTVALRRAGQYLVGLVNGRPILAYRDRDPQEGTKVAYYTRGVLAKAEATKIYSGRFFDYEFNRAPTDWRMGATTVAEVTNRWQCDPRWSFFSLRPLFYPNLYPAGNPSKLAVLWSKRQYPGDVTVEFFAGIKMTRERGGKYEYARDINLNLCSDGANLNKGYCFMFGGFGNKGSYILRDGKEAASYGRGVPSGTTNFHRHWYYVRAEKRGKRLSFRVDKFFASNPGGEIVFEDEKPLSGDRIALWTYDCGIMISRVRISGDGGRVLESPDFDAPLVTPCPCDAQPLGGEGQ